MLWLPLAVGSVLAWDGAVGLLRKVKRRRMFARAQRRAWQTGKKLMVVGDPANGFSNVMTGADYGYGDCCIDLTGCPGAPDGCEALKGRLEDLLPYLPTDAYVLFASCTFEYMDEFNADIVDELDRVSGGDIYVVTVEPWSLMSRVYPGRFFTGEANGPRRYFTKVPPEHREFAYKEVLW